MQRMVILLDAILLLCLSVTVLGWWRSERGVDQWIVRSSPRVSEGRRDRSEWFLTSAAGEVELARRGSWQVDRPPQPVEVPRMEGHRSPSLYDERPAGIVWRSYSPSESSEFLAIVHVDDRPWGLVGPKPILHRMGFGHDQVGPFWDAESGFAAVCWAVPYWFLVAPLSIIAAWRARSRWVSVTARRRVKRMICAACGYDIRATPERCPECGSTRAAAGVGAG